ncbi:polysaccharide biosynthesis/export family protein [Desulfofustis glycolicus]|uniref:Polysaccharide export outer membrane protein n=1 Tax=Desulfofustis glycolicus DSM 9705 TaxID=1121409 RepID=A0A1M5YLD3_9BACT|nr:polysaccharide biosynthesis/export family protein [Desulfofustis glycolicus]SHI12751.1 polysaccharide export outer membrane protein [Desulfofustis glycolicus DSM 9705]
MGIRWILVLLLIVSAAGLSFAADYLVGPGDVLDITVYDNDDLKTKVRVGTDGTIIMPLLGQVSVDALTVPQISDKITALLADGYLVNPQVNVFVEEFRSKKVVILGRVRNPGLVELSGPISFLELVSKAGGLEKDAGDTATIKRRAEGKDQLIPIDLVSLIEGGDMSQNLPIYDGDTVVIAKAGMCYVTGEVKEPGSYVCGDNFTVLQMIALANGFTGKASKSRVNIVRFVNGEKVVLEHVALETTQVKHNDVIVVPESFF